MLDELRLEVGPVLPEAFAFEIKAFVNGVDFTAAAAGMGMDPFVTLIPVNRLVASERPRKVAFARCGGCGFYCCSDTDVVIRREGDLVHWGWAGRHIPSDRDATFAAEAYAAEVERVAADLSWETPSRTAGRLVLTRIRERRLLPTGMITTEQIGLYPNSPDTLRMTLEIRDEYQILLEFPWQGEDPEVSAEAVCAILAGPTDHWPASWFSIKGWVETPPAIAGPSWRRERWPGE